MYAIPNVMNKVLPLLAANTALITANASEIVVAKTAIGVNASATGVNATAIGVNASAILASGFVSRGYPTAFDLKNADIVNDNTWREWDMSSVVPAGAKLVMLYLYNAEVTNQNAILQIRTKGELAVHNSMRSQISVAGEDTAFVGFVIPDENGIVEYKMPSYLSSLNIAICGWFL